MAADLRHLRLKSALLGDTLGEEGGGQEAEGERSIADGIKYVATVVYSLIVAFQLILSTHFFIKARKIKEVGWLPKMMILLANYNGISYAITFISNTYFQYYFTSTVSMCKATLANIC